MAKLEKKLDWKFFSQFFFRAVVFFDNSKASEFIIFTTGSVRFLIFQKKLHDEKKARITFSSPPGMVAGIVNGIALAGM